MQTYRSLSLVTYKVVKSKSNPSSFPAYVRLYNANEYNLPSNSRFNLMPQGGEHIILENAAYKTRFSPRHWIFALHHNQEKDHDNRGQY